MSADDRQEGGSHYKTGGEQHWTRIWRLYGAGYFVGCITKYLERYHLKNGVEDLKKAAHFLEKLIELEEEKETVKRILIAEITKSDGSEPGSGYINQG